MTHTLKTWPEYFDAVVDGRKTFEVRNEKDRTFTVGDTLHLVEYKPDTNEETGREAYCAVNYVLHGGPNGLLNGLAVMSIVHLRSKAS